jgi:hypothetical protein
MALSYSVQQALRRRTRRARHRRWQEGGLFILWMVWGLADSGRPLSWYTGLPYTNAAIQLFVEWRRRQSAPVSSLDDHAMEEHGVEFEQLGEAEQKDILRRYPVGMYLPNHRPDEREKELEREAKERAYGVLGWILPVLMVIYWVGWRLLPDGRVRAGWTDGPVVLTWVLMLVLAMPQIVRMWTEPDEVGEPKIVAAEREA